MAIPRPAGQYGIDAPWAPWSGLALGALSGVVAVLSAAAGARVLLAVLFGLLALVFLGASALYWYVTLRGKFGIWRDLLATVGSPRRALDMGCGRAAVAIMTAQQFPGVSVEGVDLWRSVNQSGNTPAAANANVAANALQGQIRITTGDMTSLPYPDSVFDLVTASMSVHNIPTEAGRAAAIGEAWRVLRPDGRLVILDILRIGEYERQLIKLGADILSVQNAGWQGWWIGPVMPSHTLTAAKRGEPA